MWNTMNCFTSEVKRVAIDKLCCKSKMKDSYYIIAINVFDNVQNDFNTKYTPNNKQNKNKPHEKQFTIACYLQIYFRIQRIHTFWNKNLNNNSQ